MFDQRAALPRDLDEMARLVGACNETYREWAPDGWVPPARTVERERESIARRFEDPQTRILVAVDAERLAAFAMWRPSWRERCCGYLSHLYVRPAAWGRGIGPALLCTCEQAMRFTGFREGELWVPKGNVRARSLYERSGWRSTGDETVHGRLGLSMRRYRRKLDLDRGVKA